MTPARRAAARRRYPGDGLRFLAARAALAAALALLWLPGEARAACAPTSPVNNADVTCTGTTVDQNFPNGYGTNTDTGNTITVVPGASVTGTANGITFNSGTVNNSGTISGGSVGIVGSAATVSNSGTIAGVSVGISAGVATVSNSGTISGGVFGITATIATVSNSGSIAGGTSGMNASDTATVSNSGTITGGTNGIAAATTNVSNSGTITGSSFGINATATANVTNSGTISAADTGINATTANVSNSGIISGGLVGINATTTTNVSNSGTISGGDFGILASGTVNVSNSGTISGGAAAALQFSGDPDTLTLLPGSTIIGAIVLGGGDDTVNFRGGNHNLTFDTLAGVTVTSTTPFVVVGNRAVAVDPTPFVVAGTTLGDFSRSVSAVVPTFDNQSGAMGGTPTAFAAPASPSSVVAAAFDGIPGLSAYAADHVAFKAPTVTHADGTRFWARGFGGQRIQQADGVVLRNVNTFFGGAMGMDKRVAPNLRIGGFIGAGSTRSSIDLNSGDTDSNLGFGGLYARYLFGASFLHAAVQGGGSRNESTRQINNNLVAGGLETATASYNGWYVSPELTLGHRIALGHVLGAQHTLTPSLQVRYLYGSFGSYTETGSTANLTVNRQTVQSFEERAELKLTRLTVLNSASALLVHLTGGALGVQRVGGNTVDAVLLGQAIPFATPGKDNVWGGFGGAGLEWRAGPVALFASAEYLALSDSSSVVSGQGGLRVAF